MHRVPRLALVAASTVVLFACAACGGSSSETPWPVEPDNVDLGPVGESRAEETGTATPKDPTAPKDTSKDQREPALEDKTEAPKSEPLVP
jgi:hypothetical protein